MRVGINIEVEPGFFGGVASAVHSLLSALGRLEGAERYLLIVRNERQAEWLKGLGANQEIVFFQEPSVNYPRRQWRRLKSLVWDRLKPSPHWPEPVLSTGFFEGLGCDVLHFPTQSFTYCATPTVYNPHDLQHLHYPQFFTVDELAWREATYPFACRIAQTVIVNSQWIKEDVARQFAVSLDKIQVIPEAMPAELAQDVSEAKKAETLSRYGLRPGFVFYPSMTWPHKNHQRLFEALAYLRDKHGLKMQLVCTGARHEASWPKLTERIEALRLQDQVRFLGFVSAAELKSLYALARCLVLPTLFEANSLPIFEAWAEGTPVASSNVTALPEQVMDAGLLFDPLDPEAMGDAIARLFQDDALCADLRTNGKARLADFDWNRTARAYRAVYRRTAGLRLSEEDNELLAWDWMRHPKRDEGI